MLKIKEKLQSEQVKSDYNLTLTLPFERRIISRQKVTLDNGMEAGLFLTRGSVLQHGDYLLAESGEKIIIQSADEQVSTLKCEDPLMLARACYHLGNRHVPLQISKGFIRYQHDHVLDDMLHGLGLHIEVEQAPFEPEPGAYGGGHKHGDDSYDHNHHHSHHSHDSRDHSHSHSS